MGIRAIGMLYVFYAGGKSRAMKLLLLIASLAAPVILAGGLLPFFVIGKMPYSIAEWLLALVFGSLALVSTTLISSSFFQYLSNRTRQKGYLDAFVKSSLILFLAVTLFSIPIIVNIAPHLIPGLEHYLPELGTLAVLNLMFLLVKDGKYPGLRFASAIALFAALFLTISLSQLPYIIYPTSTVFSTFTDPVSARIMLGALGIALVFLIPSLALLYYLFAVKNNAVHGES
jgi:cytochrome bd-type quinol oxidase subunit 2